MNQPPDPFLSICIPTRNRAACLQELLESIASQIESDVEVIVSDDACTDYTPEVVESFRHRLPSLHYARFDPPLRYDRNILKIVELARGQFCWLFGDDDRMESNALTSVLQALRANPNLTGMTIGRISYDHRLQQRIPVRALKQNETVIFSDSTTAFLTLLDRLGFLSCQIVNRRIWNDIVNAENLAAYFNGYVQLYVIIRMLNAVPRWMFLANQCVGFRSDNDSFRTLGHFGRLRMDVCGYESIIGANFGRESDVYHRAMCEIAGTHVRHHIVTAKRLGVAPSIYLQSAALCIRQFARYPRFWIETFPILLMPRPMLLGLRNIYQTMRGEKDRSAPGKRVSVH
ncbi:MAG: glycosyltransferase family 2 protein [Verrucomicrobia bacterium]|nr:glycosyltransferase family 2 protein [Verrucomicrobiota bacterium]